jgi:hypothetical protein
VCRQCAQYGFGIRALHHDTHVIAWLAPQKDMGALELPGKMTALPETRSQVAASVKIGRPVPS